MSDVLRGLRWGLYLAIALPLGFLAAWILTRIGAAIIGLRLADLLLVPLLFILPALIFTALERRHYRSDPRTDTRAHARYGEGS